MPARLAAGTLPFRWALLLAALVAASAATTWRVRLLVAGAAASESVPASAVAAAIRPADLLQEEPRRGSRPRTPILPGRAGFRAVASPRHTPAGTPASEVDAWTIRLATNQHAEVQEALERMGSYQPLIQQALTKHGLPRELIYLALIESGFAPRATSRVGAGGIWQLMPATARMYGLEISAYVDERRDPVRATDAAVRHLGWLHQRFGSWHLAAAAYNAGDGRVGTLLRELTGADGGDEALYWMIRPYLPRETREYVPKLLAAARIARAPEQFGFRAGAGKAPPPFREVVVAGGVPLAAVAAREGVPAAALYELNPHLIRGETPPGRRWAVRVPATARASGGRSLSLTRPVRPGGLSSGM